MFWQVAGTLALALWFGGGVVAGFIAPQAAFGVLADRAQAGSIAGIVLGRYAGIAVISGLVYVATWFFSGVSPRPFRKRSLMVVGAALLVIAFSQWYVSPQVAALRTQMATVGVTPDLQSRFDSFHTLSVILFGVQWLLAGTALVLHALRGQQSFQTGSR